MAVKPIQFGTLKSVCVLRPDHIGDLVLSTPFLKALRAQAPQAHISLVVFPYACGVLDGVSFVDEIIVCNAAQIDECLTNIRQQKFDLAIALSSRTFAYRLARRTGAKMRAGYVDASRPLAVIFCCWFYLTHVYTANVLARYGSCGQMPHEVEQIRAFGRAIGLDYEDQSLCMGYEPIDAAYGQSVVSAWDKPSLAVHLHKKWLSQGWTVELLTVLVEELLKLVGGGGIVVTYGAAETLLADQLADSLGLRGLCDVDLARGRQNAGHQAFRVKFEGNLSPKQWASIYDACACVVSPDTGAVHIAAAVKTPVVSVFEAENADACVQQWAPWQVPHYSVVKGEPSATLSAIVADVKKLLN